jgi:hypothetical protein
MDKWWRVMFNSSPSRTCYAFLVTDI